MKEFKLYSLNRKLSLSLHLPILPVCLGLGNKEGNEGSVTR